jgi:hypothetical protein
MQGDHMQMSDPQMTDMPMDTNMDHSSHNMMPNDNSTTPQGMDHIMHDMSDGAINMNHDEHSEMMEQAQ